MYVYFCLGLVTPWVRQVSSDNYCMLHVITHNQPDALLPLLSCESATKCKTTKHTTVPTETANVPWWIQRSREWSTDCPRALVTVVHASGHWQGAVHFCLRRGGAATLFKVTDPALLAKVRDLKAAKVKSVHRIEHLRRWHQYKTRVDVMQKEHACYNFEILDAWFPPRCLKSTRRRFAKFDGGLSTASLPRSSLLHSDGNAQVMTDSQAFFDCGEPDVEDGNDKILLHSTSYWNCDAIVLSVFDYRTCRNGIYGIWRLLCICSLHKPINNPRWSNHVGRRTGFDHCTRGPWWRLLYNWNVS